MAVRILLIDDHRMVREALRSILQRESDLEVIGECGDGLRAVELVDEMQPDVVVMDLAIPGLNGVDATRQITEKRPETRVVALSSHTGREWVLAALRAGAVGYVLKAGAFDDLCRAVRAASLGKSYLAAEVAGLVIDANVARSARDSGGAFELLTPREREVLAWIAKGQSSARIAERLSLSPHTVETHRRNLMRKLGICNVAALTRYAIRQGLVFVDD